VKFKIVKSSPDDAEQQKALENALAELKIRVGRTSKGRIVLDIPTGEDAQAVRQMLARYGVDLEQLEELNVKPVIEGILESKKKLT